jgi:hypothetical protein
MPQSWPASGAWRKSGTLQANDAHLHAHRTV